MSDMETGYKLFKKSVIQSIDIKEKSFGIEPEITVKLAKKNLYFMRFQSHIGADLMRKEKK